MMHWDGWYQSDFWLGLILGFGIMAIIMLVGFYLLLQNVQELRQSVNNVESKIDNTQKRVDDVARKLEEI